MDQNFPPPNPTQWLKSWKYLVCIVVSCCVLHAEPTCSSVLAVKVLPHTCDTVPVVSIRYLEKNLIQIALVNRTQRHPGHTGEDRRSNAIPKHHRQFADAVAPPTGATMKKWSAIMVRTKEPVCWLMVDTPPLDGCQVLCFYSSRGSNTSKIMRSEK